MPLQLSRTRSITRNRAPPQRYSPSLETMAPSSVSEDHNQDHCTHEIARGNRCGGLEMLADASTASNTRSLTSEAADGNVKKPPNKNKRKAPSRSTESKVPLKSTEAAQEPCCICLTPPSPGDLASVNACDHAFCFECIEKWAERENTCPLCKTRFTKIDRVHKKPRRSRAEVAAKAPAHKNTKTVKTRNQASDRGRIPIQDLLATMEVPESSVPSRNFFHLLLSSPLGSQLGLDLVAGGTSTSALGSNFRMEEDSTGNFFSEDDDSLDGEFQSFIFNRTFHRAASMTSTTRRVNPFSSINLTQNNSNRGSSADNPLEILDDDDEDDSDVMIIMNHNNEQQQQRPPTPHPYV